MTAYEPCSVYSPALRQWFGLLCQHSVDAPETGATHGRPARTIGGLVVTGNS
jgi:hypothetical protein